MARDADTPPPDDACRPCRGTGKVISNLGGSPSTVDCPWCEGSGRMLPEHDAQGNETRWDRPATS